MNLVERDIFKKSDGKTVFFVARVCHERQKVALIDQGSWFNQKSQYKKPVIYSFKDIKSQLNSGKLIADGCLQLPAMMLKTEKWLENTNKDKWLFQRDKNYRIIKSIVEDEDIFERYIFGDGITEEIQKIQSKFSIKSSGVIYRILNRLITFGSIKNSLLPIAYKQCGNRVVYDKPDDNQIKRGRKTRKNRHGQIVGCKSKTRGITAQDKLNILKILKEFKITNTKAFKEFSMTKLFGEFQSKYQSHVILRSIGDEVIYYNWLHEEKDRISKQQFYYHVNSLLSDEELLKHKLGKLTFEKDKAVKIGLARDSVLGSGDCYAIDATILDIYVRYPYNPKIKSCGRPVLYLVVDVWSTCIVGYYIGFHGPDWAGAGEALYHACMNKSDWAKSISWDLDENAWPCHHVPRIIFGDNGAEYSEYNIKAMLKAEIGIKMMNYAAIFRGDAKSVVERKFGVINKTFLNFQPGYVHKATLRELPHAANNAVWDYRSLVIAIGKEIIFHNNNVNRLKLHNFIMSREGIGITPQAIYTAGMEREMGGGRIIKDLAKLRFAFLREEVATVHGDCVKHNGLEYEYPNGIERGVYGKAKYKGSYKIPVRITNATVSYIWHRDDDGNIIELRLKDVDHWAQNQRREVVMDKLEEYAEEVYELEQKALQERLQLNFDHTQAMAVNAAQILDHPARKSMPSDIKEAKLVMIEKDHNNIVQMIREGFKSDKLRYTDPSASNDIDDDLYANY